MNLEIKDLSFSYKKDLILDNINFSVNSGEILCLFGSNGAGKTTLLKCINNILKPDKGQILIDGVDTKTYNAKDLSTYFSYVAQEENIVFPISVIETILMGRTNKIGFRVGEEDKDIVFKIIDDLNLGDLAFKDIDQISGGERQRVLIARALAQETSIILLDEPTSNLDMKNQLDTLRRIEEIVKEKNLIAIISIHDLNLASMYGDKGILMKDSSVYDMGELKDIINIKNLREVYEVEALVEDIKGYKRVILEKNQN